ncbi:DUF4402 domain-containing protein [Sphingorhabdus arenilitoris]|uniref:DUF4402 domain-containing protein n=1 Tax=Sphingorhabdus arenilitoris TaxID=1490041 RepID=A0ABV8RJ23_9SPHN
MGTINLKSSKLAIASIAAYAAMLGPTNAAYAATESANGEAAIVQPLTLIKRDDLNMGTIIPGVSADVVTLNVNGSRSSGGNVSLIGANHQVARFAGQGSLGQLVIISIDPSTNLTGPGPNMLMNNFQFGPDNSVPGTYLPLGVGGNIVLLDPSGVYGFVVGADLAVGAGQPGGTYSGTFTVTADYL